MVFGADHLGAIVLYVLMGFCWFTHRAISSALFQHNPRLVSSPQCSTADGGLAGSGYIRQLLGFGCSRWLMICITHPTPHSRSGTMEPDYRVASEILYALSLGPYLCQC
jgi:hypothetical protein